MIEQQAVVSSVDSNFAYVEATPDNACGNCSGKSGCGTGLAATLLRGKPRLLKVRNTQGVRKGDLVTIGLNRTALMMGSLLVYFLPLVMLILGAIAGESLAAAVLPTANDLLSIIGGLVFAILAFIFSRRVLNSGSLERLFQPVLIPDSVTRPVQQFR